MIELTPTQLDLYLRFFDVYDRAITETYAKTSHQNPLAITIDKALQSADENLSILRRYKRARDGSNWLDDISHKRLLQFIHQNDSTYNTTHLNEIFFIYSSVKKFLRNHKYWGVGMLSSNSLDDKYYTLVSRNDPYCIFTDRYLLNTIIEHNITSMAGSEKHGTAITNSFVIANYMTRRRESIISVFGEEIFALSMLNITRIGAYLCQTVGQWYKFNYFAKKTKYLVEAGHSSAKVIYNEHLKHLNRRNTIENQVPIMNFAHEAFSLDLQLSPRKHLRYSDPILLLNVLDEGINLGFNSINISSRLQIPSTVSIIEEINLGLEEGLFPPNLEDLFHLNLAELYINDINFFEAQTKIGLTSTSPTLYASATFKRSVARTQARLIYKEGGNSAPYYERARAECIATGAFHLAHEIDQILMKKTRS